MGSSQNFGDWDKKHVIELLERIKQSERTTDEI